MKEKAAAALLGVGLLQMAGDVLGVPALKGLGMATAASPAPRVFTSMRGMEPFSTRFFLEWRTRDGAAHTLELTPEVYARLGGAYNRRNAYGAALAAGPVLATDPRTDQMLRSVLSYALCGGAALLQELGIETGELDGPPVVRYAPRPTAAMGGLPLLIRPECR